MTDVESLLGDTLCECQSLTEFANEAKLSRGRGDAQLKIRDGEVYVNLYTAGDGAVVVVGYAGEVELEDTAFVGDVETAHKALTRLNRHSECEILWDALSVFDGD